MTGKHENTIDGKTPGSSSPTVEEFGRLYEEYLPRVYQYVSYRINDKATAEDITSDIFNRALNGFTGFDPGKASFSTWIFSISRNTVIDYYRKHDKETEIRRDIEPDVPSRSDTPEESASRSEETERLHECLRKLNITEQELISLKFSSGITNREISRITGLTESNVGTILCRAIRKLRDDFAGW